MYCFIVNPNSRSGAGRKIWARVKSVLDERSLEYRFALTKHVGHAKQLAEEFTSSAREGSPVTLVVLGGDGTIHEALSGIKDPENVIFGYIPAGSGNDFCRGMNLPRDPMEALETILTLGVPAKLDLPVIRYGNESSRFGISCGIGYDAAVCHEVLVTPLKKVFNALHLGKLVYGLVAVKQMLTIKPVSAEIRLDGDRSYNYKRMYFAAVMNQKYEGGGFKFCPDAKPDDGLLDIIIADSISKPRMFFMLPTVKWGGHVGSKGIHIMQCRSAEIHCSSPYAVHIDGESGGIRKDISVYVEPVQLTIIVPQNARRS